MSTAIEDFYSRQDLIGFAKNFNRRAALHAKFMLGEKLERDCDDNEDLIVFEDLHSQHVASKQQDYAVAVFPLLRGYQLPAPSQRMSLPGLVEDGLEQYERLLKSRCCSKLPKGLFELGTESYRCKPSLYLHSDYIKHLGDVFGALSSGGALYTSSKESAHPKICFRDTGGPPSSRLSQSKTYATAFGDKNTAAAQSFMRAAGRLSQRTFWGFQQVEPHSAWAGAIVRNEIAAPYDKWPSRAHEKAVFADSLHNTTSWNAWPEVDHERVCFELMCDFVGIHPDIARKERLGLVVKVEEPPCIGFVNGAVYDCMRRVEQNCQGQSVESIASLSHTNTFSLEASLTLWPSDVGGEKDSTFELMKTDSCFDEQSAEDVLRFRSVSEYMVVGVWFLCERDDPCIGADLGARESAEYDAILI